MPSLFNGVCYPTAEAAKAQACSAASLTWGSGSSVHTLECASTSFEGPTMTLCKRTDGGACTLIQQDYPAFPDCDYAGGTDLALDWMYAALLLFVMLFGLKRLIALFSGTDKE